MRRLTRISIHTSAREVTNDEWKLRYGTKISIHTSAREVTILLLALLVLIGYFNPHFRKGSDADCIGARLTVTDFNPHFRKGSDWFSVIKIILLVISIHTSAREVTVHPGAYQRGSAISIHTSAREVTQRRDHKVLFFRISIHTSAREVTRTMPVYQLIRPISIHTSAREVTDYN